MLEVTYCKGHTVGDILQAKYSRQHAVDDTAAEPCFLHALDKTTPTSCPLRYHCSSSTEQRRSQDDLFIRPRVTTKGRRTGGNRALTIDDNWSHLGESFCDEGRAKVARSPVTIEHSAE